MCAYHFLDLLWSLHICRSVLGEDGDPELDRSTAGIRVKVGNVCEVDCGAVLDGLETATGVEVSDCADFGRVGDGSFGVLNGGAEGARVGELVGGDTGGELMRNRCQPMGSGYPWDQLVV